MKLDVINVGNMLYSFSQGLKRARKGKKWTQDNLAENMGVSLETVRNWEQGRNPPNGEKLLRLCDLFDCDMDYLFNRIDCKKHDNEYIHNEIGLSEDAIIRLKNMYYLNRITGRSDTISLLIEHESFEYLLCLLSATVKGEITATTVNNALIHIDSQAIVRNEIRTTIERIAADIQKKTLEVGVNEYARLMYGILFDLHRDGQITEDEFKEVLSEYDKGNIEYCPEWLTQRIEEVKKHGN